MFSHGTIESVTSFVIVDGKFVVPGIEWEQEAVVKADAIALSVAAASILAKTYRDRLMMRLAKKFPNYGFEVHKGYATRKHREALAIHGLSEIHRQSFCTAYL
jgi:ribonuclease HII